MTVSRARSFTSRLIGCSSRGLLDPELIHAHERRRVLDFERVPEIEIAQRSIVRVSLAEFLGVDTRKADEREIVFFQKRLDLRQRQRVFLHVKEQVAALAGAEKIGKFRNILQRRPILLREDVLPAPSDVLDRAAVTVLRNIGTGGADVGPRNGTVKPDMHESTRSKQ